MGYLLVPPRSLEFQVDQQSFYQQIGHEIRRQRRERKMTQATLASRVSLTRTSITNIEKGRQKLMLHKLAEIAEVLSIPTSQLLPSESENVTELDRLLHNRPELEREWIKSALASPQKQI